MFQVFNPGCFIFIEMFHVDFECSMKHEANPAAVFLLIINGWLTIFFSMF